MDCNLDQEEDHRYDTLSFVVTKKKQRVLTVEGTCSKCKTRLSVYDSALTLEGHHTGQDNLEGRRST